MITVPVLIGFDQTRQIGTLNIDEKYLPEYSNYVFSIGYRANKLDLSPNRIDKVEALLEVSLLTDDQYIGFLRSVGKL